MYLGAYSLEFPSSREDPCKTQVTVTIDDQPFVALADRLEGGQKLLMPSDATQSIITALLENRIVTIKAGRYLTEIITANFCELYGELVMSP